MGAFPPDSIRFQSEPKSKCLQAWSRNWKLGGRTCTFSTSLDSRHLFLLHVCPSCSSGRRQMIFMTKGNESFLVNSLLRWVACFQAHVFPFRLNTMILDSLKPILCSEREASNLLTFLSFLTAATFYYLKHPSLKRTSKTISPGTVSELLLERSNGKKYTRGIF